MQKTSSILILMMSIIFTLSSTDLFAQPFNDECATPQVLMVNTDLNCGAFISGTLVNATASIDPENCAGSFDDDVWYSFVATGTTHEIQVSNIAGSTPDLVFQLSEGTCGALTELDCHDTPNTGFTATGLVATNTYYVRVATFTGTSGQTTTFDICIGTPPPPPSNDECSSPATLMESTDISCMNSVSGTTLSATQSGETILCSTFNNNDDVWYEFIPTQTKKYFFKVSNTSSTTYVNIYDGTCAGGLTSIGLSCAASDNSADLIMGTTYLVQVNTSGSFTTTDFDLCAYPSPFPVNQMVTCGTPIADTHCYNANDIATWLYTSSDGITPLQIAFTAGGIETGFDEIIIYDGVDNTAPILFQGDNGGNLTGLSVNSTGPNLFFEIDSDGGVDCDQGSTCCLGPWDWTVDCLTCSPGAGTAIRGMCDEVNAEFMIDVDVTDIGDGTIIISNDAGLASTTVTTTGMTSVGPFAFGTVTITLEHPTDPVCNVVLPAVTTNGCPPSNDDCPNAENLTVNADLNCGFFTSGTLEFSTASIDTENCAGTFDDDVWYSFVATGTTHEIQVSNITGSTTDLVFQLSEGACGTLTELDCHDTPNSGFTATGLIATNIYYVRIASSTAIVGQSTSFDICIGTPPPPPANDDCSNAESLTVNADLNCGIFTTGTLEFSTASSDAEGCSGTFDDDVWYSFVATGTIHEVQVSNIAGSTTDLVFQLSEGTCGALTELDCHDIPDAGFTVTGLTPTNTYYVRVASFTSTGGQTTSFDICIGTPPPPPSNDACNAAITIFESVNYNCAMTINGTTISATQSTEKTLCSTTSNDDDVWYEFTPMLTIDYVFELSNTTTGTYVHVYSGDCVPELTNVGTCFSTNTQTISLVANTTYLVQVHTSSTTIQSNFDLCIYPLTCLPVTTLDFTGNTISTVDISWTAGGSESVWDIEVVLAGATPTGTPTYNDVTANNPYTVTGLMPDTDYDIYVRADCGMDNTDISTWESISVFTLCLESPTCGSGYLMDFDGSSSATCWLIGGGPSTGPIGASGGLPDWGITPYLNGSGNLAGTYNLFSAGNEDWLTTPVVDLSGGGNFMLTFDIALTGWNDTTPADTLMGIDDQVQLLITTDGGASWTNLQTWDATSNIPHTGQAVSVDLSAYSGTIQLGFWATDGVSDDANDVEFFFDNFSIDCVSICPPEYTASNGNRLTGIETATADYETDGSLESDQMIEATAIVDYDSGMDIILLPGFNTVPGALFTAFIDGCMGAMFGGEDEEKSKKKSNLKEENKLERKD